MDADDRLLLRQFRGNGCGESRHPFAPGLAGDRWRVPVHRDTEIPEHPEQTAHAVMQPGLRLLCQYEGIAPFGQAVREDVGNRRGGANALIVEQGDIESGVAHHAGHVQHQIARTAGGVMDAHGIGVILFEQLANRIRRPVDDPEKLVDIARHQRRRCFTQQQFGLGRHKTERRHQGAR